MIIEISARIDAAAVADEPFGIKIPPYAIDVGCDAERRVVELRVQKQVVLADLRLPTLRLDDDGTTRVDLATDDPHFEDLRGLLQYLESIGSFWFGIYRVHLAEAKYSWIPETEEEKGSAQIFSSTGSRRYNDTIRQIKPDILARTLQARSRLGHLTIPMAFFREGVNEHREFRYVAAFHNLYFFLEGLFGEGKTKNKDVKRQFLASPILMAAVDRARHRLEAPDQRRHLANLNSLRELRGIPWTPDGLVSLIVWMRGNLHHFSLNSSTPKGHPLNQRDFESIAFLLQLVCHEVVAQVAR